MSRKLPKNYGKASKQAHTSVTPEEERQAKRVIAGITIGLIVAMIVMVGAYYLLRN